MPEIHSKSIYHGLPVFSSEIKGLTAIVTGPSGISGHQKLKVFCKTRVAGRNLRSQSSASWLSARGVCAVYVFCFAYIQPAPKGAGLWGAEEEMVNVNQNLLVNFLSSLNLNNTIPKRVLLQQESKYYGVHYGPASCPLEETDPRVLTGPSFYCDQEDYQKAFAEEHQIGWNTTRPFHIEEILQQPLEYHSSLKAWETNVSISSAQANGHLVEWAVLTEETKNERYRGVALVQAMKPPTRQSRFPPIHRTVMVLPTWVTSASIGQIGRTANWTKTPEVQKAWAEIAEKHGLREEFGDFDRVVGFADLLLALTWSISLSMSKAKKMRVFRVC
ncbi:hypothetical protein N7508_003601 [Penicillium antarcticum]|uniref:uncharacterized protein n=1 Tax=Penicillium antarcticum TaxID=416450 RepID=UPI00238E9828|nr:uncharacterized protein N7508_003601 [Penicillium antarcticum]KAJ5312771.1 hypothetical protein N7508_003601 [Penicillium antarcticum]